MLLKIVYITEDIFTVTPYTCVVNNVIFVLAVVKVLSDLFDLALTIFVNNPLIFVSFTLLYSRGVPFVINKYCSYHLSYIPVKYRSGIGVWLRCVWFGFNPPLGNIFIKVNINEKCAKHARVSLQAR